jgi:hypothetical protein
LALGITFAILTVSIVALALTAEGSFTARDLKPHSPIFIDGNADFGLEDGVTSGSGTEADPFVIEGWEIYALGAYGIAVNSTDAYLVIRNVSVAAHWSPYYYFVGEASRDPVGISIRNASNVKVESSFISGFQSGVRANGNPGVTKGFVISRCTFTSTGLGVVISDTSDCRVTHSFFNVLYNCVALISNCSSITCSFNEINAISNYHFPTTLRNAIRIENVTGCTLDENDISAWEYNNCVYVVDTEDARITNNSVECYSYTDIVAERCTRILISRNEMSRGGGISVTDCSNARVDSNLLHADSYYAGSLGISASNSVDLVISGNVVIKGGGIFLSDTHDGWVHDNHVTGTGDYAPSSDYVRGMWTYRCSNLNISRNVIANGTAQGLNLLLGVNVTVEGNEIYGNSGGLGSAYMGTGLYAQGSNLHIRYNKIFSNTIGGTVVSPGVVLDICSSSTFEYNNISDAVEVRFCDNLTVGSNTFDGRWNLSTTSWGETTTFQQNNFLVGVNIIIDSGYSNLTHWDAGYPYGGNYWLSYIGVDLMSGPNQNIPGSDGFGDTAYQVSGGETDNYPRMQPVSVQDVLPPITNAIYNGTLGHRMWYTSNVSVVLTAYDSNTSALDIRYSLDSGPWSAYISEILVTGDGIHKLQFHSEDDQGNMEDTKTIEVRVDTEAPSLASDLQREYNFRTKTADTMYIYANFTDSQSDVSYLETRNDAYSYGSSYNLYSSCDWFRVIPVTGIQNATFEAVDGAGNSHTYTIKISASVSPNTNPFSPGGPYGWWLILARIADIGLGLAALGVAASRREKRSLISRTDRTNGERHYDEDVVDGYPKFSRRI